MLRRDGKVREIWGRQFRIVRDGLEEAEVFAFVGRLIEQNSELSSRLEHVDSLKKLAENAVIEASKQAERIKIETREEADEKAKEIIIKAEEEIKAKAERIIAEAEKSSLDRIAASEQLVQDMLKAAEEKGKAQAERIVAEAEEKAKAQAAKIITEAEEKAKARAERIVAEAQDKAKARAEEETKAEAERIIAEAEKGALDRIAASEQLAQDMLEAAEEKGKAQAAMVITEAEEKAKALAAKVMADAKQKAKVQAAKVMNEAEQKAKAEAESIIAEAKPRAEELAQEKLSVAEQKAKEIIRDAEEKAEETKRLGEEVASRIVVEAKRRTEEEAVLVRREAEQALPASGKVAESEIRGIVKKVLEQSLSNSEYTEKTTAISTGEEGKAPQPSATQAAVRALGDTVGEKLREQDSLAQDEADRDENPALYQGAVELAIPPPVAMSKMLRLHRALTKTRQVNVLDVVGSAGKGVIIRLFLRRPTLLVDMLEQMPEVQEAAPAAKPVSKTHTPQRGSGEADARRIVVTTKR